MYVLRKGIPLYSYFFWMGLEPSILFDREGSGSLGFLGWQHAIFWGGGVFRSKHFFLYILESGVLLMVANISYKVGYPTIVLSRVK